MPTATVTAGLDFDTSLISLDPLQVQDVAETITNSQYQDGAMSVPTTAGGTAIPLGGLAGGALGRYEIINKDPTNYVELMTAVSGTKFNKIPANGAVLGYFSSNITAPAVIAVGGACQIQFRLLGV